MSASTSALINEDVPQYYHSTSCLSRRRKNRTPDIARHPCSNGENRLTSRGHLSRLSRKTSYHTCTESFSMYAFDLLWIPSLRQHEEGQVETTGRPSVRYVRGILQAVTNFWLFLCHQDFDPLAESHSIVVWRRNT